MLKQRELSMDDDGRIVEEFLQLVERSQQLFAGLREIPEFGYKAWQAYFDKTFSIYSKVWAAAVCLKQIVVEISARTQENT